MADNYTYAALIGQAITDFDNIWTALKTKTGLKHASQNLGAVACPTSDYATLVGKLTYVNGYTGGATLNSINAYDTAVIKNSTSAGVVLGDDGYTVSSNLTDAGYYTSTPTIATVVEVTPVSLKALLKGTPEGVTLTGTNGTAYEITGSSTLLGTVTIDKGNVEHDLTNDSIVGTAALSNEITLGTKGSTATVTFEEVSASEVSTGDYYIKVSSVADVTAASKITVDGTISKTEGYIDGEDITIDLEKAITKTANTGTAETYIRLPKGGASAELVSDNVEADIGETISDTLDIDTIFTTTNTGIAINPSISGVKVKSTTAEGYVEANTTGTVTDVTVDISDVKKYIKTTTLTDIDKLSFDSKSFEVMTDTTDVITTGSASGAYQMVVRTEYKKEETFTKGYLTTDSRDITIEDSTAVYIKQGSVKPTAAITGYDIDDKSNITSSNGAYVIDVTPTLTVSSKNGFVEGYVKDGDVSETDIKTTLENAKTSIKIAKGSVTVAAPVLTTTLTNTGEGEGDAGNNETTSLANIFKTAAPTTGDYYTVTTTVGTPTTVSGYVTSNEVSRIANGVSTYYIPKATFEWVTGGTGDEENEYLQVKTPGYLPSGKIVDITGTSLTENNAVISLDYNFGTITATTTDTEDYYKVSVLTQGIDAGYISDDKGTISNTDIYIKNGSITGAPSLSSKTGGTTWDVTGNKYKTTVTGAIAHGTTLDVGYVTSSAVTDGTYSIDVELDKAEISRTSHSVVGSMSHGVVSAADEGDTTYGITFNVSECTSVLSTSTAGYLAAGRTITLSDNENHNVRGNTFYIKSGNKSNATATLTTHSVDFVDPDFSAATGDYTISFTGSANAEIVIPEGYYPANSKITKAVTGTINDSYTLARGAGTASVTNGTNTIDSDSVVYYTKSTDVSNISHVSITSTPSAVAHVDISRDGYIKDEEIADSAATTLGTTTIYIESFVAENSVSNSVPEYTDETETIAKVYYDVTIGDTTIPADYETATQTQRIDTEAKYMSNDIKVSIGAHTMGSSVVSKLKELENRLAGLSASGAVIS